MTRKEQNKILDDKIESNINQYKVDGLNAEISAFSSSDLSKYEFLTRKDLKYKTNALDKVRFEFSPLGKLFSTRLDKTAQGYQEGGVIKLLKDIRDGLRGGVNRLDDDRLDRPDDRLDRPDARLDRPDDRLDRPGDRPDRPDDRPDRPDHRPDRPDDRLDRPDDNNDDNNDKISEYQEVINSLLEKINNSDNNNKISEYQEVINSLLEKINNNDDNDDNVALNSVFLNNLNNEISNVKSDGEYYARLMNYECDLDRMNAEISAYSSGNLPKYEYLTKKYLGYKPEKVKFEYSPIGKVFTDGLAKEDKSKKVGLFKRLNNIEDNLVEVDDNDNKVGIYRIMKDIKDRGIKIDNDDEAVREIRERIKELIDDGVKVNDFDEMKEEIIDHIKKLKKQGINVRVDEDQINDLINKISDKKIKIKIKNIYI